MSSCSCVLSSGDGDSCEGVVTKTVKERKEDKCCQCHETIHKGDKYVVDSGIWDGRPERFRTCLTCYDVAKAFFCNGYTFGGIWGDLREHLYRMYPKTPVDCIACLPPKAREKVCATVEEIWARAEKRE